jgi:hypothetical protein
VSWFRKSSGIPAPRQSKAYSQIGHSDSLPFSVAKKQSSVDNLFTQPTLRASVKTVKILVVVSVVCLMTASLLAQGRINFANNSSTAIYVGYTSLSHDPIPGSFVVLGTASTATFGIGPASVRISLFAGLSSSSLAPVLIGTAANQTYVTNTTSGIASAQGTFAGGNPLPLPGFDGSAPVFLQMQIHAINGMGFGISPIIQVTPSLSPFSATPVFGPPGTPNVWTTADIWGMDGFGLRIGPPPVPEPSALALTGCSALMFFARRKMR